MTLILHEEPKIVSPTACYQLLKRFHKKQTEHFFVITLNGANNATKLHVVTIGILNKTIVHPREVFIEAIRDRAASIIVAHNHPSKKLDPSCADIEITDRLVEAGKLLGIECIDHIIFSSTGFLSLAEAGHIRSFQ